MHVLPYQKDAPALKPVCIPIEPNRAGSDQIRGLAGDGVEEVRSVRWFYGNIDTDGCASRTGIDLRLSSQLPYTRAHAGYAHS